MSAPASPEPRFELTLGQPGPDVRRLIDAAVALFLLIFFLPLLTCITVAVWLEDGGAVLFAQLRLGRKGRCFKLLKFRKFKCDKHGGPNLTLDGDRRMTRVGMFLERSKLDELPQLWNILLGDMALVGPRPESLPFADCFRGPYRELLDYRPGLFGPCQTLFRHERAYYRHAEDLEEFYRQVLFPLKARIDLAYYSNRTVRSDMAWALRSVLAVAGWSSLPKEAATDVNRLDDWVRRFERIPAERPSGPKLAQRPSTG